MTRLNKTFVSAVLFGVVAGACGGGGDGSSAQDTPISEAPAELVGDWKYGTASFTNFWDSQGQYVGGGGGTSVFFHIEPDGHYSQQVYLNRRNYNCLMETWTETVGTATFEDGAFTVYPTRGRYKASDTCTAKNNFDRAMTDQERDDSVQHFLWKFEENGYGDGKTYLMLGFDENTWSPFEPAE